MRTAPAVAQQCAQGPSRVLPGIVPPAYRRGAPAALPRSASRRRLISTIGFERGLDTLVWQLIASVATPGYTIHTVVALATWVLGKAEESAQVGEPPQHGERRAGCRFDASNQHLLAGASSVLRADRWDAAPVALHGLASVSKRRGTAAQAATRITFRAHTVRFGPGPHSLPPPVNAARRASAAPCTVPMQVVGALEQAASAAGISSEAFIETFNKSVPTALGLLGESRRTRPRRRQACGRAPRVRAARTAWPYMSVCRLPAPRILANAHLRDFAAPVPTCSNPRDCASHRLCGARRPQRDAAARHAALHLPGGGRRGGGAGHLRRLQALRSATRNCALSWSLHIKFCLSRPLECHLPP